MRMHNDDLAKILIQRSYLKRSEAEPHFRLASGGTTREDSDCQATTMRA